MRQDIQTQAIYMAAWLALSMVNSAQAGSIIFKTVGQRYCDDSYPWDCYDTPSYCNTLSLPDDKTDATWANVMKACPMLTKSNKECQSEPRSECERFSWFSGFYQDICSPPSWYTSAQDCPGYFAGFHRKWNSVAGADNGAGHQCVKAFLKRTTCPEPVWGTTEDIVITTGLAVLAVCLFNCLVRCFKSNQASSATASESLLSVGNNYGAVGTQAEQVTTGSVNSDNVERGPDYDSESGDTIATSPTFSTVHDLLSSISILWQNSDAPDAERMDIDVENPEDVDYLSLN